MSISTTFTLRFSGADVQRGLVMITRQINSLGRAASGLGKSLVTPFAGLTAMLAPAAIGAGFLSMIKNASDTASRFEQMTLKFQMFTGSLEGAKKVMQGLRDIDMVSNLDIESLGNAQAKLMAYGFTAEDALKSVERLSKVSGGNADVFSSLALAFGQTKSAMKLKGDDLRQYTERGWNPLQQIMAATGETFAEVSKRMKLGKIGFEEVNWALRSITEGTGKFAKAHDLGSKTFLAATSRMKTQYMLLQNEFGKPFNVSLGEIFDRIAAKIPLMNEEARKLGESIGNTMVQLVNSFEQGRLGTVIQSAFLVAVTKAGETLLSYTRYAAEEFAKTLSNLITKFNNTTELTPNYNKIPDKFQYLPQAQLFRAGELLYSGKDNLLEALGKTIDQSKLEGLKDVDIKSSDTVEQRKEKINAARLKRYDGLFNSDDYKNQLKFNLITRVPSIPFSGKPLSESILPSAFKSDFNQLQGLSPAEQLRIKNLAPSQVSYGSISKQNIDTEQHRLMREMTEQLKGVNQKLSPQP